MPVPAHILVHLPAVDTVGKAHERFAVAVVAVASQTRFAGGIVVGPFEVDHNRLADTSSGSDSGTMMFLETRTLWYLIGWDIAAADRSR